MKHIRLTLFSIFFAILWPSLVQACSCVPFRERSQISGIIVSGVIEADVEGGIVSPWSSHSSRLIAERVWSGPDQREFRLISLPGRSSTCGGGFVGRPGERVILWLSRFGDDFYSARGMCSVLPWDHKERPAVEASLRGTLAAYDDVDRRLRARPDDPQHWRWRLKVATGLKDDYSRLRSLRRLIDLATSPDVALLKDAAAAATAVGDDDVATRYVDRALMLAPDDSALKTIRERIARRRTYDKTTLSASLKLLDDIIWIGQRDDDALIEGARILNFQIERSTFGGLISGTELYDGIIRDTSLVGITIRLSKLAGVLIRNVTLSDAVFSNVEIMGARIIDSTFLEARLSDVRLLGDLDRVAFRRARLTRMDFVGKELTDIDFTGASLDQVKFHRARMTNANFTGAKLDSTEFSADVVLRRADFSGARVGGMGARGVDFRDARFIGAIIGNIDFGFADLRGADFSGASLTIRDTGDGPLRGAKYDNQTKWPATYIDQSGKLIPFNPAEHGAILVKD